VLLNIEKLVATCCTRRDVRYSFVVLIGSIYFENRLVSSVDRELQLHIIFTHENKDQKSPRIVLPMVISYDVDVTGGPSSIC
jgi:hypothetical protein